MASIEDLMLEAEKINESIIPIIKLSDEIRKHLLDMILGKLIILPDFLPEEEDIEEGQISRYGNFQEFINNMNLYFYSNIKITEENFQKYFEELPSESLSAFSAFRSSETSSNNPEYVPEVSQLYETISGILTVPEFMGYNTNKIYEISGTYEKPEAGEKISSQESETAKYYTSAVSQLYERIEEISAVIPEFIVNNAGTISEISGTSGKPEAEEKISSQESKSAMITMSAILQLYEKIYGISEEFTKLQGFTADNKNIFVNNSSIISEISGINEKSETRNKIFQEYKTSQKYASAISRVYNKIDEISTAYTGEILNLKEKLEESDYMSTSENTVSEAYMNYINYLNSTPEMRETVESTAEKISESFNTISYLNYLTSGAGTAKEAGEGYKVKVNMHEIYEKINILSRTGEYSEEIAERVSNAISERSVINNIYEHDKEAGFLDALSSFETTKIDQIFPVISALTPQAQPSSKVSRTTNNTFNITITAKSISEERDLKDLGKKIGMILAEEVRRSGGL